MPKNTLWFRAKRFGWGWYPVSWQGWAIIVMYVFVIFANDVYLIRHESSISDYLMQFFPTAFILTVFLIIICYAFGEKPGWRWGIIKGEVVDVLNEQGEKTGKVAARSQTYEQGYWSAAADVWVVNSKKEVLLQLRSTLKENNPNIWDISASGRVLSRESTLGGAIREIHEELGLSLSPSELQYIGTARESDVLGKRIVNIFSSIYVLRKDIDLAALKLQESEVAKVAWVSLDELKRRVHANDATLCPHPAEYEMLFDFLENSNGTR